ncbi:MAG: ABC transporter ATP-binding protein [Actinomyces urogenitalis]|uniref:ABC transporter, ATP-binding protein n=3 Tax=root TaxID=1 RepID=C0W338_9ACTO|nr:ABC transporter ATP-binding protein [Actinomyces urogenitalis]EEH66850.1 ABC transporter, ATP-binding protein [Actinomyces urogenitalis DSM 15434]MBS5976267.1 ABC transporter ATP-binding protein [Actinomyces urogenitalis]MBS6071653.1 ABC transporter ATP-binding protein [Actinomyces urogenitalis]MDK8835827.1 ABC transporter ATP-binding protein [Actinomyces urogenitalis]MDU0971549.1 ABC transporter ATP-binding protein [Actinomyces urogenitalis]
MLFRTLRHYLRPYWPSLLAVLALKVVETIAALSLPTLNADIINDGVVAGDTDRIWVLGGQMLAITALQGVSAVIGTYLAAKASMGLGRAMRADVFNHVQRFNTEEVSRFGAPSLVTRSTNDVQQIQMVVFMIASMMLMAPIMLVGGTIMALRVDAPLSALLLVLIPLLLVVVGLLMSRLLPHFKSMQSRIDRVNLVMREQIQGVRVIRAFVRQRQRREVFDRANQDLTTTSLAIGRLFALLMPSVMLIMNLATIAVMWFGGQRISSGGMEVGDLTAFLNYIMQILFSVLIAVMLVTLLPRAQVAADRIGEVMAVHPAISSPASPQTLPAAEGPGRGRRVRLDKVTFRYPGAASRVLAEIDLEMAPGTMTAVIGSTGSGKTTLVGLLPRLLDATEGRVSIDGVDVRDLDLAELRSVVATVPQKAFLFSGTIRSTLRHGKSDATDDELWAALEAAQAADFVRQLDDGLDHEVDQGGVNFSGGQRQRLAIARALVRPAGVYIFDDSFSALDYATDARLRAGLPEATDGATLLVVAQRVASIRGADQIVVLDEGHVVGIGRHEELMDTCPTYAEIVLSQISAEEAA